ncbi:J domain-containing protein [Solirubrobacter sp. CPCC 204708]|uniref:J domain-containing protein n=1 Tax=Solirubrobacter deserti TaxID=2282478 RepID=A0ABT4RES3_9ACTN|nr:J domain-containing protein [Solirubrobacter deserti]MBE2318581.1 J domain-containing protein [Solirubrobacter deserti]MDA0137039.1 J domain-containing protein [Solirubrobacter deserti]
MDPYEALGIDPSFDGDLRVVRNRLVKQYSEVGATPDEERMKAVNLAYAALRDRHVSRPPRVVFRGGPGSSFVLDGQRFVIARRPRQPAAIAAPVLGAGALVLAFGWAGAAVVVLIALVRQYQRMHRHRRRHRA